METPLTLTSRSYTLPARVCHHRPLSTVPDYLRPYLLTPDFRHLATMPSSFLTGASSESQKSTPASSPPPADMSDHNEGISREMQAEEDRMRAQREKDDAKRNVELERERQEDLKSGKEILDEKFRQLEFLMNKSKVSPLPGVQLRFFQLFCSAC
jgi:hypothetical protein